MSFVSQLWLPILLAAVAGPLRAGETVERGARARRCGG